MQQWGWRASFLALAVLSLTVLPFALFGLDGAPTAQAKLSPDTHGASRSQALRSRSFWTLIVGFTLVGGSVPAVIPHMVPMLTERGLAPTVAATIAGLIGIGVIVGRLCIGVLLDRFFAPFVAAPIFLVTAAGCLLLMEGGPTMAPVAAVMIGISFGAEADLVAYFCGFYFGLRSYGFLYGIIYAIFALAVAVGPIWVSVVYDGTGGYTSALVVIAGLLSVGAVSLLTLPRKPSYISNADISPERVDAPATLLP
jgi:predicted MFS family arabinose efflux permease